MVNEIVPYENPAQKKKSFLGGIFGFLLCVKKPTPPAYQEIQSIHHVLPREGILRQMIDIFIANTERPRITPDDGKIKISWEQFLRQEADSYSEAMTGAPVCVLVKTPTDAWLVALTRTVKIRWPDLIFTSRPKTYERYNLDDAESFLKKQLQTREYEVLRDTECWKAIVSPFKNKKLDLMSGYWFKWKGSPVNALQKPLSEKSTLNSARLFTLDIPHLLTHLQNFHSTIEMDEQKKKKYISSEIYTRPEDYDHPRSVGHMTEYFLSGGSLTGFRGRYFADPGLVAHGVEDNFNGLYLVREISYSGTERRIVIPAPQNGVRLLYKAEEKMYLPLRKVPELEQRS